MQHYAICIECHALNSQSAVLAVGELNNDLFAICKCRNGHIMVSGLMHHVPDVLYMSTMNAFRRGCYSESVLTFAASFERTCELFVKAFSAKKGATLPLVEEMWEEMKSQSERQYGAFCSSFAITTGEAWKADTKRVKFRNNVVHKGYIATRSECESYAGYVTANLDKIITILNKDFEIECQKLYFFNKEALRPKIDAAIKENPGAKYSSTSIPSLLGWNDGNRQSLTFQDALRTAEEMEQRYGFRA